MGGRPGEGEAGGGLGAGGQDGDVRRCAPQPPLDPAIFAVPGEPTSLFACSLGLEAVESCRKVPRSNGPV